MPPKRHRPARGGSPSPSGGDGSDAAAAAAVVSPLMDSAALNTLFERLEVKLKEVVDASIEDKHKEQLAIDGPLSELMRTVFTEELNAFAQRQPSAAVVKADLVKSVTSAVVHVLRTTPQVRSPDQMNKEELHDALNKALETKLLRDQHPKVLNRRTIAVGADPLTKKDVLTISFPAASKTRATYSNEQFSKIVKVIVHEVYERNALIQVEKRPTVFRNKTRLLVRHMDRIDRAADAVTRNALHDGRSETRKLFWKLFAVYLSRPGASMQLSKPDAVAPTLGAGTNSDYFAVLCKIRATTTGEVPDDDGTAELESEDPLDGVHVVVRSACLYVIAELFLQAIVRATHPFDAEAVNSVACNLRDILLDTDRSWTTMSLKAAELLPGSCAWALLCPLKDGRDALEKEVQTLLPTERQAVMAQAAHRGVHDEDGDGDVGAGVGGAGMLDEDDQPAWLLN